MDPITPEAEARLKNISDPTTKRTRINFVRAAIETGDKNPEARRRLTRRATAAATAQGIHAKQAQLSLQRTGTIPEKGYSIRHRALSGTPLAQWWWMHPPIVVGP